MNAKIGVLFALFSVIGSGCATVSDNAAPVNVAGTWKGSFNVRGWGSGDIPMMVTVEQAGQRVTGDVQTSRCTARFEGTVSADMLYIQPAGCPAMRFSVKGDEMTGEYPNPYGTMNAVSLRRNK
jgi:hypothetical protein